MGLFDMNPEQSQALLGLATGLLSNSGPSTQPRSFGQALGGGLGGMQNAIQQGLQQKYLKSEIGAKNLSTASSLQLLNARRQMAGLPPLSMEDAAASTPQALASPLPTSPAASPQQAMPPFQSQATPEQTDFTAQRMGVPPTAPMVPQGGPMAPQGGQNGVPDPRQMYAQGQSLWLAGDPSGVQMMKEAAALMPELQAPLKQATTAAEQGMVRSPQGVYSLAPGWGQSQADLKGGIAGAEARARVAPAIAEAGGKAAAEAPYKGYPVQAGGSVVFPFGSGAPAAVPAMPGSPTAAPPSGWQPGSRVWSDPRINPNTMEGEAGKEIFTASDQASQQMQNTEAMRSLLGLYRQGGGSQGWTEPLRAQFSQVLQGFNIDPKALGLPADAGPAVAMDALANKMALGNIGPGGLPANNFSEADRKFIRDMQGNIKDPASAFEAKLLIAEASAARSQLKERVYLETVGQGKTITDFRREWNKVKDQPMFSPDQLGHLKALAQTQSSTYTATPPAPQKGEVRGGYKYLGGDPSSPMSWGKP